MRVYFIRHAEAVEPDDFEGADLQRPLTKLGRKRAAQAYRRLARVISPPDIIVSSEAVRAVETAKVLKERMPGARLIKSPHFNPGRGLTGFRTFFKTLRGKNFDIAIVGHEPDLSHIISFIVAEGKLQMRLKKGACAEIEVNASGRGVLKALLTLSALTGAE